VTDVAIKAAQKNWQRNAPVEFRWLLDAVPFEAPDA
jgi:hypothetical protein